jgi:hypothetical protein
LGFQICASLIPAAQAAGTKQRPSRVAWAEASRRWTLCICVGDLRDARLKSVVSLRHNRERISYHATVLSSNPGVTFIQMSLIPFNGANPSNILAALYQDVSPEQVISLQIICEARSAAPDNWRLVQQVLSHPSVYEAFGIESLPLNFHFDSARGLEVIGTLANVLDSGGIHNRFVESFEIALAEARRYLDVFFLCDYRRAVAYSSHGAWCDWFIGEGVLDETVLVGNGQEWWLLAVTSTD